MAVCIAYFDLSREQAGGVQEVLGGAVAVVFVEHLAFGVSGNGAMEPFREVSSFLDL